jgi:hypothetical protein
MCRPQKIAAAAVLTATIAGAAHVSAQTRAGAQAKPATGELAPGLSEKPFSRLFGTPQLSEVERRLFEAAAALQREMRPNSARRFICGMPVLLGDSAIDPRIELRPPATTTRFTLQIVQPTCR